MPEPNRGSRFHLPWLPLAPLLEILFTANRHTPDPELGLILRDPDTEVGEHSETKGDDMSMINPDGQDRTDTAMLRP